MVIVTQVTTKSVAQSAVLLMAGLFPLNPDCGYANLGALNI